MFKAVFASALLLLSLPGAAAPFTLTRDGETLQFSGELSAESSEAISGQLRMGVRKLVIGNSSGEDSRIGRRLASAIVKNKVAVSVESSCTQTCAAYVFLAGTSKELREGAILGLRGGIPETLPDSASARFSSLLLDRVESAASALTLHAAPVGKLLDAPGLINKAVYASDTGEPTQSYYFPSRATLEKAGVKGLGNYPYPSDALALTELGRHHQINLTGDFPEASQ